MKCFIRQNPVSSFPYDIVECTFVSQENCRKDFIQAATRFFLKSWMNDEMHEIWLHWNDVSQEDKEFYRAQWEHLLSNGVLIDDPSMQSPPPRSRHTAPIGAFSETMLRWFRENFEPAQLLVEPLKSMPTEDGKIDLIEITGSRGDYASFKVTLWEVKSSDSQISSHNSNVYQQLDDYRLRFLRAAYSLSESYTGDDKAFKRFLSQMGKMAWKKDPSIHYAVFVTYDSNVIQKRNFVPTIHKHPSNHPSTSKDVCHHLVLLLAPDFRSLRLEVWQSLHLL